MLATSRLIRANFSRCGVGLGLPFWYDTYLQSGGSGVNCACLYLSDESHEKSKKPLQPVVCLVDRVARLVRQLHTTESAPTRVFGHEHDMTLKGVHRLLTVFLQGCTENHERYPGFLGGRRAWIALMAPLDQLTSSSKFKPAYQQEPLEQFVCDGDCRLELDP